METHGQEAPAIVHARVQGMRSTILQTYKSEPEVFVEFDERIPGMVRAGRVLRGFVAARQPHFHVAADLDERADGLLTGTASVHPKW